MAHFTSLGTAASPASLLCFCSSDTIPSTTSTLPCVASTSLSIPMSSCVRPPRLSSSSALSSSSSGYIYRRSTTTPPGFFFSAALPPPPPLSSSSPSLVSSQIPSSRQVIDPHHHSLHSHSSSSANFNCVQYSSNRRRVAMAPSSFSASSDSHPYPPSSSFRVSGNSLVTTAAHSPVSSFIVPFSSSVPSPRMVGVPSSSTIRGGIMCTPDSSSNSRLKRNYAFQPFAVSNLPSTSPIVGRSAIRCNICRSSSNDYHISSSFAASSSSVAATHSSMSIPTSIIAAASQFSASIVPPTPSVSTAATYLRRPPPPPPPPLPPSINNNNRHHFDHRNTVNHNQSPSSSFSTSSCIVGIRSSGIRSSPFTTISHFPSCGLSTSSFGDRRVVPYHSFAVPLIVPNHLSRLPSSRACLPASSSSTSVSRQAPIVMIPSTTSLAKEDDIISYSTSSGYRNSTHHPPPFISVATTTSVNNISLGRKSFSSRMSQPLAAAYYHHPSSLTSSSSLSSYSSLSRSSSMILAYAASSPSIPTTISSAALGTFASFRDFQQHLNINSSISKERTPVAAITTAACDGGLSSSSSSSMAKQCLSSCSSSSSSSSQIPSEVLFLLCFYLTGEELSCFCIVSRLWYHVCAELQQPLWQEMVLKKFGFKYENYVLYTNQTNWRLMYGKAATFLRNMRKGRPVKKEFKRLLFPGLPHYEGSLAMTADCSTLLWENGEVLQAVDVLKGRQLFCIPVPGPRTPLTRPCLVNTKTKIFLHLNGEIRVYCMKTGIYLQKLVIPDNRDWHPNDFSLDVSIRNQQLTFLATDALYVFDSETLEFLYKVVQREVNPLEDTSQDIDFLWAGYRCVSGTGDGCGTNMARACLRCQVQGLQVSGCRHRSRHIVTWLKKRSCNIKIFDMRNGKEILVLKGHEHKLLRVRQAQNLYRLEHYYLASLDTFGVIRLWDSSPIQGFNCLQIIETNNPVTFRLSFTSTHMMIMSELRNSRQVVVKVWKFDPSIINSATTSGRRPLHLDSSSTSSSISQQIKRSSEMREVTEPSSSLPPNSEGRPRRVSNNECYVGLISGRFYLYDPSSSRGGKKEKEVVASTLPRVINGSKTNAEGDHAGLASVKCLKRFICDLPTPIPSHTYELEDEEGKMYDDISEENTVDDYDHRFVEDDEEEKDFEEDDFFDEEDEDDDADYGDEENRRLINLKGYETSTVGSPISRLSSELRNASLSSSPNTYSRHHRLWKDDGTTTTTKMESKNDSGSSRSLSNNNKSIMNVIRLPSATTYDHFTDSTTTMRAPRRVQKNKTPTTKTEASRPSLPPVFKTIVPSVSSSSSSSSLPFLSFIETPLSSSASFDLKTPRPVNPLVSSLSLRLPPMAIDVDPLDPQPDVPLSFLNSTSSAHYVCENDQFNFSSSPFSSSSCCSLEMDSAAPPLEEKDDDLFFSIKRKGGRSRRVGEMPSSLRMSSSSSSPSFLSSSTHSNSSCRLKRHREEGREIMRSGGRRGAKGATCHGSSSTSIITNTTTSSSRNIVYGIQSDNNNSLTFNPPSPDSFKSVMTETATYLLSESSYFGDFIDNQLIGVWLSIQRQGHHFSATLSDWEVFDCLDGTSLADDRRREDSNGGGGGGDHAMRVTTQETSTRSLGEPQEPQRGGGSYMNLPEGGPAKVLEGTQSFSMNGRGDIWTLLDWKCLSIHPTGDVTVFDFCPISQQTPRRIDTSGVRN